MLPWPGRAEEPIRLAVMPWLTSAPLLLALDSGHFERAGLTVEVVPQTRSLSAIPPLAAGKLDVLAAQVTPGLVNVIHRGADVRVVAARAYYGDTGCVSSAFVARADLLDSGRLASPADLAGLRLAADRSSAATYNTAMLLAAGGLSLEDVELVTVTVPLTADALANGRLDVSGASEPWLLRARAAGARVWLETRQILPDYQYSHLLFGPRLLRQAPDAGRRFVAAYLEGVRQYREEGKSPRNLEILARHTGHSTADLEAMCWPPISADGVVDVDQLERYQRWAKARGLIDAIVAPERLVDGRFLPSPAGGTAAATREPGGAP
ncbi:MAG: ABC transporter substrate-binding protein [Thermoanaerobaculia bacterium]|nr:ABC transporter substrate-binding protein [Thermoanaerobaculia bacterium]